jgi:mono/diheme cytochrome c family protein
MVNKIARRQVGIFTLFLTTFAMLSLLGPAVFAVEAVEPERKGNPQTFGGQEKEFPNGMIQKVGHEGMSHNNPMDIEEPPQGICPQERNTAQAPEPFDKMTNPLDPTPQNLRAGETLFKIDAQPTACKVCHGFGGDGMGVIFEQLTPKPRNFTCYYTMDDIPDGQIYWIIKNGSPGTRMPSFGVLSDKEVWQLVLYIRQFSQKK